MATGVLNKILMAVLHNGRDQALETAGIFDFPWEHLTLALEQKVQEIKSRLTSGMKGAAAWTETCIKAFAPPFCFACS